MVRTTLAPPIPAPLPVAITENTSDAYADRALNPTRTSTTRKKTRPKPFPGITALHPPASICKQSTVIIQNFRQCASRPTGPGRQAGHDRPDSDSRISRGYPKVYCQDLALLDVGRDRLVDQGLVKAGNERRRPLPWIESKGVIISGAEVRHFEAPRFGTACGLDKLRLPQSVILRHQNNGRASAIFHRAANAAAFRLENDLDRE